MRAGGAPAGAAGASSLGDTRSVALAEATAEEGSDSVIAILSGCAGASATDGPSADRQGEGILEALWPDGGERLAQIKASVVEGPADDHPFDAEGCQGQQRE